MSAIELSNGSLIALSRCHFRRLIEDLLECSDLGSNLRDYLNSSLADSTYYVSLKSLSECDSKKFMGTLRIYRNALGVDKPEDFPIEQSFRRYLLELDEILRLSN